MQDETLGVRTASVVVEFLGFVQRSQRGEGQRLRFATGEEGGTVSPGDEIHFATQRTELIDATSVATILFVEDGNAEGLLLEVVEGLGHFEAASFREFGQNGGVHFIPQSFHGLAAGDLRGLIESGFDAVHQQRRKPLPAVRPWRARG